jgi:hypothetical protein
MSSRRPALPWAGGGVPGLLQNDVFYIVCVLHHASLYLGKDDFGKISV